MSVYARNLNAVAKTLQAQLQEAVEKLISRFRRASPDVSTGQLLVQEWKMAAATFLP
jgi:hypothetical protein